MRQDGLNCSEVSKVSSVQDKLYKLNEKKGTLAKYLLSAKISNELMIFNNI